MGNFLTQKEIETSLYDWRYKGFVQLNILNDSECDIINEELDKLRLNRNKESIWSEYEPYAYPQKESKLLEKYFVHPKLIEVSELLIGSEIIGLQDWAYFKKPGELGRDMHQNVFYTGCEWNEVLNSSIALDDADKENGAVWCYPGSHNLQQLPIEIIEERTMTNPNNWTNERGKPCVMPDGHNFSKEYCESKRGQVTIIHSHCVHGSDKNTSKNRFRRSLLGGYLKKGAYFNKGNHMKRKTIDVYKLKEKHWDE